jgi:hypothetical protein
MVKILMNVSKTALKMRLRNIRSHWFFKEIFITLLPFLAIGYITLNFVPFTPETLQILFSVAAITFPILLATISIVFPEYEDKAEKAHVKAVEFVTSKVEKNSEKIKLLALALERPYRVTKIILRSTILALISFFFSLFAIFRITGVEIYFQSVSLATSTLLMINLGYAIYDISKYLLKRISTAIDYIEQHLSENNRI